MAAFERVGQAGLPGLNRDAVEGWIAANVDGAAGPMSFRPVGRGRSNLTYIVEDSHGSNFVLRRPPLGRHAESTYDLAREFTIIRRLSAVGQPVPRPLALCDDLRVTGSQFYVMERIEGIVADSPEAVDIGLSLGARASVGLELGRTLGRLHAVDLDAAGLGRPGRGDAYAARQLHRWSRQWESMKTRELPEFDRLTTRLSASVPRQSAITIVHGDFTIFNVILGPDGQVRGILDWELSTVGDPVADLAWLLMWWPEDEQSAAPGAASVPLMEGFTDRASIIDAYAGATNHDLADLGWWQVLSYWKLAAILEGILHRWLQDPANGGEEPESLRPGVAKLISLGEQTADRLGL